MLRYVEHTGVHTHRYCHRYLLALGVQTGVSMGELPRWESLTHLVRTILSREEKMLTGRQSSTFC